MANAAVRGAVDNENVRLTAQKLAQLLKLLPETLVETMKLKRNWTALSQA